MSEPFPCDLPTLPLFPFEWVMSAGAGAALRRAGQAVDAAGGVGPGGGLRDGVGAAKSLPARPVGSDWLDRVDGLPVGVVRIDGGWRVWSSARFHVDVLRMMGGNLRVVTTPVERPLEYTRAWCFQRPLVEVVLAALAFDPDDRASEPAGWVKQVGTERRPCGWLRKSAGACGVRAGLPGLWG